LAGVEGVSSDYLTAFTRGGFVATGDAPASAFAGSKTYFGSYPGIPSNPTPSVPATLGAADAYGMRPVHASFTFDEEGLQPVMTQVNGPDSLGLSLFGSTTVTDAPLSGAIAVFTPVEDLPFSGDVATFTDGDPTGQVAD